MRNMVKRMLCGATLALCLPAAAWAANGAPACTGFSKYSAQRAVAGAVLESGSDRLGIAHIILRDAGTGCRVYVLMSDTGSCGSGRHFEGRGRLRSDFKGEDYDATLTLGRDRGSCS